MSSFNRGFAINAPVAAPLPNETNDLLLADFNEDQKKYIVRELYPLLKQSLNQVSFFLFWLNLLWQFMSVSIDSYHFKLSLDTSSAKLLSKEELSEMKT